MGPTRITEVLGVVKAYTSRVGAGPFPSELLDDTGDWIREKGHEYGTTTGRPRRCGWLDAVSLRYAARINGFTGLAITRLDILSGLPEVKICIGYRLPDGTVTENYPIDTDILGQVEAVYESWPGWDATLDDASSWSDLPANVQAYCQRVAALVDVPIYFASVGAERSALVALKWPF